MSETNIPSLFQSGSCFPLQHPLSSPPSGYQGGVLDSLSLHLTLTSHLPAHSSTQSHRTTSHPCTAHILSPAPSHLRKATSLLSYPLQSVLENSSQQSELLKCKEATPPTNSTLPTFLSVQESTMGCLWGTSLTQALPSTCEVSATPPLCWDSHSMDGMLQDLCAGCSLFLEHSPADGCVAYPLIS